MVASRMRLRRSRWAEEPSSSVAVAVAVPAGLFVVVMRSPCSVRRDSGGLQVG